jgi:hypothetical protein
VFCHGAVESNALKSHAMQGETSRSAQQWCTREEDRRKEEEEAAALRVNDG